MCLCSSTESLKQHQTRVEYLEDTRFIPSGFTKTAEGYFWANHTSGYNSTDAEAALGPNVHLAKLDTSEEGTLFLYQQLLHPCPHHWRIYIQNFPAHAPLRDQILSFSHTFSPTRARVRGPHPQKRVHTPPYGKSRICPCSCHTYGRYVNRALLDT